MELILFLSMSHVNMLVTCVQVCKYLHIHVSMLAHVHVHVHVHMHVTVFVVLVQSKNNASQ